MLQTEFKLRENLLGIRQQICIIISGDTCLFSKEKFNSSKHNDVTDVISLSLVLFSFLNINLTQLRINCLERKNFISGIVRVQLPRAISVWDGFDLYGNAQTTINGAILRQVGVAMLESFVSMSQRLSRQAASFHPF